MDPDGLIQADENVDLLQKKLSPRQRNGRTTMLAATGGVDTEPESQYNEQVPLLSSNSDSDGEDDANPRPMWDEDYSEWDGLPWYRKPSVYWLLIPFVFSAMAMGGIMIPKINLILSLICREYYSDQALDPDHSVNTPRLGGSVPDECRTPEVSARVATFTLQLSLISGILSAIIAPKLGALSDRYGRRKIMMITNAGSLCGEIITIFAATYPETFNVHVIFIGSFIDGLAGSFIASMAISHAYATDCTPPAKRNVIFGYFHGMMMVGIALGPAIAAKIIQVTGNVITMFYLALACHLTFITLLIFFIPESVSKSRQMKARETHKMAVEAQQRNGAPDWFTQLRQMNLFEPLKILWPTGRGTSVAVRRNLVLLSAVDTIIFGVGTGAMSVVAIYSIRAFHWDVEQQSVFIAIVNSARVLCLLVILPVITRLFRGKTSSPRGRPAPKTGMDLFELSIIRLAIFFDTLGYLGYTLARTGPLFILSGTVASMGSIGSPTLQASLTKHVPPGQVGQLLGAMALLHAVARVLSPTFFSLLFAATVGKFDQAVFVVLTFMFGVAWGVSWLLKPGVRLEAVEEEYRRRESSLRPDLAQEPLISA
ncbi:MFS general substrate transporter [Microthyrium microscopicum]|uniref:MFS general substrate transporter n=1 Tax=Microthyrium microscopicum TaxID=703497 RepID=A0A6A6UVY6_9PEZI|nr:MFS general substrate transporter [Microthyrium microscopicum]